MVFTKEELSFLEMYSQNSDREVVKNDKLQIKTRKDGFVIFSQFSSELTFITKLAKPVDEEFTVLLPVTKIAGLIKVISDTTEITITKDFVKFNDSIYEFEKQNFELIDTDHFLQLCELGGEKRTIKSLKLAYPMINYTGKDKLNCVSVSDEYFVACMSNDTVSAAVWTGEKASEDFYLSKAVIKLLSSYDVDEVELDIFVDQSFYSFKVEGTFVCNTPKPYMLPDLFDNDIKEIYEHPYKVFMSKKDLLTALNRIQVVSSGNVNNRIYCTFNKDSFSIESKDSGYAIEKVNAETDIQLTEKNDNWENQIIVSSALLSLIAKDLKGEYIRIYTSPSKDTIACKITDEFEKTFFIHCLFKYE
jgi:hypothetical protein